MTAPFTVGLIGALSIALLLPILGGCSRGRVEELDEPRRVRTVSGTTIVLEDGEALSVPGLDALVDAPQTLAMVFRHGVEIAPEGTLWVALDVYSGCAKCVPSYRRRRIELGLLLRFVADPSVLRAPGALPIGVNRAGMSVGTLRRFESWRGQR